MTILPVMSKVKRLTTSFICLVICGLVICGLTLFQIEIIKQNSTPGSNFFFFKEQGPNLQSVSFQLDHTDLCHNNLVSLHNFRSWNGSTNPKIQKQRVVPFESYMFGQRTLTLFEEMMFLLDIPYIASSGTFVATLRNADMLPWDHDLDVLVFASHLHKIIATMECDSKRLKFQQNLYGSIDNFCRNYIKPWLKNDPERGAMILKYREYFSLGEYAPSRRFSHLKLKIKTSSIETLDLDIFPMHIASRNTSIYIQPNDFSVPYDVMFPLHKRPYGGHLISVANEPYQIAPRLPGFNNKTRDIVNSCGWIDCKAIMQYFPFVTSRKRIASNSFESLTPSQDPFLFSNTNWPNMISDDRTTGPLPVATTKDKGIKDRIVSSLTRHFWWLMSSLNSFLIKNRSRSRQSIQREKSLMLLKYLQADRLAETMNVTIRDIEDDEIAFQQTQEFFETYQITFGKNVTEKLIELDRKGPIPIR